MTDNTDKLPDENENTAGGGDATGKEALEEAVAAGIAEERAAENADGPTTTPEARGEQVGEALEAAAAAEAHAAASPEGQQRDRKAHRGVLIAVVAFAVLLIGAGVAYSVLAPAAESETSANSAVHTTEVPTDDTSPNGNGANATEGDTADAASQENAAPEFTMTNSEGETLTLADFRGKPVLLNFWASWCGPCQSEMPAIQAAFDQYGSQVQFVIVNMTGMGGETAEAASALIQQEGYTFPVYFDVNSSAATAFGVTSIPQTYLIDADGNIIAGVRGAMSDDVLEEAMQMLLGTE